MLPVSAMLPDNVKLSVVCVTLMMMTEIVAIESLVYNNKLDFTQLVSWEIFSDTSDWEFDPQIATILLPAETIFGGAPIYELLKRQ